MKHLGLAITVAAAVGTLVGPGPLRANCGVISQRGIYDVSSSSSASDRALAYRAWFCQQNISSASQANQVGLDIGYDSFELGFDQEKESWQQFYYSFCSDTSYDSRFRQQTETFTQRINERVVAALQACLTQRGLHAWIEQGVDGRSFVLRTVFVPASKSDYRNLPRVEAFNVIGATCQGALAKGARIGPDGTEMLCHRRSAATPVQIGFDATSFVNKDTPLGLAPVFRPPPPPKAEPLTIAAVSYVRGDGIASNGPIILNNTNPNKDRPNMATHLSRGGRERGF